MRRSIAVGLLFIASSASAQQQSQVGRAIVDPCNADSKGRVGFDEAWQNATLIADGFPREMVCSRFPGSVEGLARKYASMTPDELETQQRMAQRRLDLVILGYARDITALRALSDGTAVDPWSEQNEMEAQELVRSGEARQMIEAEAIAQAQAER